MERIRSLLSLDNSDYNSEAKSIFKDSKGDIYVVGSVSNNKNHPSWSVRKSTNLGETWNTVDEFTSTQNSCGVYNNTTVSITENNQGELFVLGSIYHNSSDLLTPRTQKSLIRKSIDRGITWNTINTYGNFTVPYKIISCFGNVLFEIISSTEYSYSDLVRRSDDNGVTWTDLKLTNTITNGNKNIICLNNSEVIILANSTVENLILNSNQENKLLKLHSTDKGLTWSESTIQFKDKLLNKFIVSTMTFDDNYFWLGGKTIGETENWVIIKSSYDFKESFIVDTFVDPKAKAKVESIINCKTGICAIGNSYEPTKDQEVFSLFRFITFK